MQIPLRRYWALLSDYLAPQRRSVAALATLLALQIGLQLANPQILRYFLDTAQAPGSTQTLIVAAALFLGLGLGGQVIAVVAAYATNRVAWIATNNLRADVAQHCLGLDMHFHTAHTPGELLERVDGDVTVLSNFFSQFVLLVLGNLILTIGVLLLLFREDWRVGAVLTLFALGTLLVLFRLRGAATPYWQAGRQASALLFGFLEERLSGIKDIRANGANTYVLRRFADVTREQFRRGRAAVVMGMAIASISGILLTLGSTGALAVGATLFQAGTLTIGTVYLIVYYTGLLFRPLQVLIWQVDDLQKAGASISRIEELTRMQPTLVDGPGAPLGAGAPALEMESVSFAYGAGRAVLEQISFRLAPGQVLGVLGRTGSGKTTIARLLLRLYDPSGGRITLDGVDIRAARLADLRRHIGIVTQDVQLLRATVRDNLTFFDRSISDQRIIGVLHELGLGPWYATLPQGLDTELAAGGAGLSAGQAQLLAFSRVFLKDPGVVILDEASSRLDPATERLIEQAIERLLRGRTAIVIAHRLRTVERVDQIMMLEQGRIVEHGAREELARNPQSQFYRLLRLGVEEALA